ncbi:MAG: caspase family protein [Bacteroidetes bacterium]|nr:caspase family protein [Bacteroidota bacterium]
MKQIILFFVLLLCIRTTSYSQSPSPVYNISYEPEVQNTRSTSYVASIFKGVSESILGEKAPYEYARKGSGSIVLPISTKELLIGKSWAKKVSYSPNPKYFVVELDEGQRFYSTCYLFDNENGKCSEVFENVRQWKFSADGNQLIITSHEKWSVYSIPDHKEVFTTSYLHDYAYGGNESERITLLDSNYILVMENNDSLGDKVYLYSSLQNSLEFTFTPKRRFYRGGLRENNFVYSTGGYFGGTSYVFDIAKKKNIIKIENALFLNWAQHSSHFLFYDPTTKTINEYDLNKRKKFKLLEAGYVGRVNYIRDDSLVVIDPSDFQYLLPEHTGISIYNRYSKKIIRKIDGEYSYLNPNNKDFLVVYRFASGAYYPVLINSKTFNEVMKMDKNCFMTISKSGRYLILKRGKDGFSIIDLKTSRRKLKFEDRVRVDAFDEQNGVIISFKDNVLNFHSISEKGKLISLTVNSDGWVCFDEKGRYDRSRAFRDRIFFSCTSRDIEDQEWPVSHVNKSMHVPNLWSMVLNGKAADIKAPELKACQSEKLGNGSWIYKSDDLYKWASLEQHKLASVNFVVDQEDEIVDLGNFSGKPVTVHKSGILFQCNVWNGKGSALLVTFYADHFGGYLALTPDGYFAKSNSFRGKVAISIEGQIYATDQLFERYFRPDIIEGILSNSNKGNRDTHKISKGILRPPKVSVTLSTDSGSRGRGGKVVQTTTSKKLFVEVNARNQGGGIMRLRLLNNGKLVGDYSALPSEQMGSLTKTFEIIPSSGTNLIEVIGVSLDYTESKPASIYYTHAPSAQSSKKPILYLLSVGINEYKNASYNLSYCVNDMQAFADTMYSISLALFDHTKIITLKDSQATRENILMALDGISKQAQPEDVFVFYYAGHGVALNDQEGNSFFFVANKVTQMSDLKNCQRYGISGMEMKDKLRAISANKQISFIDACNSGAFAEQYTLRGPQIEQSIAKLSRSTGSAIYASTTSKQSAAEYETLGHGVFTYVLLDALNGATSLKNCQVTVANLKGYIDDQVPRLTEKHNGNRQYPITFLFGQDFPIGLRCAQ